MEGAGGRGGEQARGLEGPGGVSQAGSGGSTVLQAHGVTKTALRRSSTGPTIHLTNCGTCGVHTKSRKNLRVHVLSIHFGAQLEDHYSHSQGEGFSCNHCPTKLENRVPILNHLCVKHQVVSNQDIMEVATNVRELRQEAEQKEERPPVVKTHTPTHIKQTLQPGPQARAPPPPPYREPQLGSPTSSRPPTGDTPTPTRTKQTILGFLFPAQAQQPGTGHQQQACQAGHPSRNPETRQPGTGQQRQAGPNLWNSTPSLDLTTSSNPEQRPPGHSVVGPPPHPRPPVVEASNRQPRPSYFQLRPSNRTPRPSRLAPASSRKPDTRARTPNPSSQTPACSGKPSKNPTSSNPMGHNQSPEGHSL